MPRFLALASDYDGTLARQGVVDSTTIESLERFKRSGRKLILITGRELDELRGVCPRLDLFDRVVAENGAVLYRPGNDSVEVLAGPPPQTFVDALKARGVGPISVGRVILATWRPHETVVAEVIRSQRLDLQIILNKRAVMVLPSGVDKASGLKAALADLGLTPEATAAVGDGENDIALIELCGLGAAVANAVEVLKQKADLVLKHDHGAGVAELIDVLLEKQPSPESTP